MSTAPGNTVLKNPAAVAMLLSTLMASLLNGCMPPNNPDTKAQPAATLTDYQRAERFLAVNTAPLVSNLVEAQYWQRAHRSQLIYRRSSSADADYVLADVQTGEKTVLLDNARLSAALAPFNTATVDANSLNLTALQLSAAADELEFRHAGSTYTITLPGYVLSQHAATPANEFLSPDRSKAAFIEEFNLWVRDTTTNALTQLTFDGSADYGYATNNAGWLRAPGPVLLWSPDSSKIATFRHDGRPVREMFLYNTVVGHPELDAWKYPLPGDTAIFMIERIVVHVAPQPKLVRLEMPPDSHRSTTSDHVAANDGTFLDVEWSEDSATLAFVSSSRDHKIASLRIADPETGAVRDVYTEAVATYYEAGFNSANWRVLHDRNEFSWFSEQDNWGHLYLHDLQTGALKQQITSGNWSVQQVLRVDLENSWIYFIGANREAGDPYFQYLYRVKLDGSELTNLTPEPAHHAINWDADAAYFTDTYSTPVTAPTSVIRDSSGAVVMPLELSTTDALLASGWVAPIPFTVKARDQQTDLYGLMYKPSNFDAGQRYPVLNYLYPGPQTGSVGSRAFRASRNDKQSLAELGFIVVEVDAMGTPGRSKSFHDAYYGDMGDNGLPDQVAAIQQLGAQNSWMDLERVGIWGHSGGGYASTAGILRYPDFYKVAVSGAGNHDNRNYEDDWGEKWQGLLVTYPEAEPVPADGASTTPATNYDNQANQLLAGNLQGKLLLAHGLMDDNVHPSNTLLVVDALIEAEKDFDLLLLPNAGHGFGNGRYFMKRRWDYFVEHLQGTAPPADFRFADNIR